MNTRQFIFANRPKGLPDATSFRLESKTLNPPTSGQVVLRGLYYSVDPYMRGRMNAGKSYIEPFAVGEPFVGGVIAKVIEGQNSKLKPGDLVSGMLPWAEDFVVDEGSVEKVSLPEADVPHALGMLGMPGLAAYFGLLDIGQPKPGETVVVSGAAGAVGLTVGQIAKLKGCRAVGIAGSEEKIRALSEFGFDAGINYKKDLARSLESACPKGVDVYFDNVGGEVSDAVLERMNHRGRIVLCGQIALYNAQAQPLGPRPQPAILTRRLLMQGFVIFDYKDRYAQGFQELSKWKAQGKLRASETIVKGFERLPEALLGLFSGQNLGKMLVKAE